MAQVQAKAAGAAHLSSSTIIAFASATLPIAALGTAISVYLPRHFAAHIGISLAAVGAASPQSGSSISASIWRWA